MKLGLIFYQTMDHHLQPDEECLMSPQLEELMCLMISEGEWVRGPQKIRLCFYFYIFLYYYLVWWLSVSSCRQSVSILKLLSLSVIPMYPLQPFLISFTQINQIHFQSVAVYAYQQSVLRLKRHTLWCIKQKLLRFEIYKTRIITTGLIKSHNKPKRTDNESIITIYYYHHRISPVWVEEVFQCRNINFRCF